MGVVGEALLDLRSSFPSGGSSADRNGIGTAVQSVYPSGVETSDASTTELAGYDDTMSGRFHACGTLADHRARTGAPIGGISRPAPFCELTPVFFEPYTFYSLRIFSGFLSSGGVTPRRLSRFDRELSVGLT